MPKNPSELARLEEELKEHYKEAKNLDYPKGYREAHIRDARRIERELGLKYKELVKEGK